MPHTDFLALQSGKVPDLTLELVHTSALRASLDHRIGQWQFVSWWFREGIANTRAKPLIPILCWATLMVGQVPSLDVAFSLCGEGKGRVYCAYSGWLRELDCGLKLCSYGSVKKNFQDDLTRGIDWWCGSTSVAVRHQGDRHAGRKLAKCNADVILTATGGEGLHLVSDATILANFGQRLQE